MPLRLPAPCCLSMVTLHNSNLTTSTSRPENQTSCQPSAAIWRSLLLFSVESYTWANLSRFPLQFMEKNSCLWEQSVSIYLVVRMGSWLNRTQLHRKITGCSDWARGWTGITIVAVCGEGGQLHSCVSRWLEQSSRDARRRWKIRFI